MHRNKKIKQVYINLAALVLILGLLCPQVLWAEDLPDTNQESTKPDLTSFDEYEKTKELEREVSADFEEIESPKEEAPEILYIKDENGDIAGMKIKGEDLTIIINTPDEDKGQVNIEAISLKSSLSFSENFQAREMSDKSKLYVAKNIDGKQAPVTNFADNEQDDINVKIKEKSSKEPPNINKDKKEYTPIIKQKVTILLKAHDSAVKKFYDSALPYYKKLAPILEKAQWLWRQQNIDLRLYYAGADGMLDEKEVRQMTEDAVRYLYENTPEAVSDRTERDKILGIEKDLRVRYVTPAFDLYKRELKKASREFYESVKNVINPLTGPLANKSGGIEVIITLPKATLK